MPAVVVLSARKAVFVSSRRPRQNFSGRAELAAGVDSRGHRVRTLLYFDLPDLDSDRLLSAHLQLFVIDNLFPDHAAVFTVHPLRRSFKENKVTWNKQPSFDRKAGTILTLADEEGVYASWDLTEVVRDWITGFRPNRGLVVRASSDYRPREERQPSLRFFAGRDSSSSKRPRILLRVIDPILDVRMADRRASSRQEQVTATSTPQGTRWHRGDRVSQLTFFVHNRGPAAALVELQVSPVGDPGVLVRDGLVRTVPPGETLVLVPMFYGRFYRVLYRTLAPGTTARLNIWFQTQV